MSIRESIREQMQRLGLNQLQVAERTGLSPATISLFLNGLRDMRVQTLEHLLNKLDLKISLQSSVANPAKRPVRAKPMRKQEEVAVNEEVKGEGEQVEHPD